MKNKYSKLLLLFLLFLLTNPVSALCFADDDIDEDDPHVIVDSIGQYDEITYYEFIEYSDTYQEEHVVTKVWRDEEGRVTQLTKCYPPDPGLGVLRCNYTYDEQGRFIELKRVIENSELELIFGYARQEKMTTITYEEDGSMTQSFVNQDPIYRYTGFLYINSEGEAESGIVVQEMAFGEKLMKKAITQYEEDDWLVDMVRIPVLEQRKDSSK